MTRALLFSSGLKMNCMSLVEVIAEASYEGITQVELRLDLQIFGAGKNFGAVEAEVLKIF